MGEHNRDKKLRTDSLDLDIETVSRNTKIQKSNETFQGKTIPYCVNSAYICQ